MTWYSWPIADSLFSVTKYFTPLFPPLAMRHSHASSKSSNCCAVMMSRWPRVSAPSPDGSARQPSSIFQRSPPMSGFLYPRQALVVLPSNKRVQPALFSVGVRVLTGSGDCAPGEAASPRPRTIRTAIGRAVANMGERYHRPVSAGTEVPAPHCPSCPPGLQPSAPHVARAGVGPEL